jgi:hypothetical protein
VSVGLTEGARAVNSINLNNQPYIMTRITHQIVGNTTDPETSGLYQDGMYAIAWKDEQSVYTDAPIMANCFAGSVVAGFSYEMPFPLPYAGNKTLTFEVYNRVARTLAPGVDTFEVAIVLHGISFWGELVNDQGAPIVDQRGTPVLRRNR